MTSISFNDALKQTSPSENRGLLRGLRKTRDILTADIRDLIHTTRKIDDSILDEIETRLLIADVGIETTQNITQALRQKIEVGDVNNANTLIQTLRDILIEQLSRYPHRLEIRKHSTTTSILVIGVNGAGKTTTIGKLAKRFQRQNYSVMLAAGDTFRAAAVEQLETWGQRNQISVITQSSGSDAASVTFDALTSANAKDIDILLADTAGRLHTQDNLMQELKKIKRVMSKVDAQAPTETLLVLDATLGQNALLQAKQFHEMIGITGVVITKLDGTAKGGIVFAICEALKLPIYFIGAGEGIDDLQEFKPTAFVNALLADPETPPL